MIHSTDFQDRSSDPVDSNSMLDPHNKNVYIIAIVAKLSDRENVKYYLVVNGQVISVSFF